MADFSTTGVGEGVNNPYAPLSPVVDTSASTLVDVLGKAIAVGKEVGKVDIKGQVLGDYSSRLTQLADAREQGVMSDSEARTAMRTLFRRTTANNGSLAPEIASLHSQILSQAGLGKVLATGTEEEVRFKKQIDGASADGFIFDWMSEDQTVEATRRWARINQNRALMAEDQADVTLQSSKLSLSQNYREEQSNKLLAETHAEYMPTFSAQLRTILDGFGSSSDPQAKANALNSIDQVLSVAESSNKSMGSFASPQYREALLDVYKDLANQTKLAIDNPQELAQIESSIEKSIARAQWTALQTPDLPMTVGLLRLVKEAPVTFFEGIAGADLNLKLAGLFKGDLDPSKGKNDPGLGVVKGRLKQMLADSNSGKGSPEANEEVDRHVETLLKGVNNYRGKLEDLGAWEDVLDIFSSKDLADYVKKNGLPAELAEPAIDVYNRQYQSVVEPMLKEEYENKTVPILNLSNISAGPGNTLSVSRDNLSAASLIIPEMTPGGSVRFIVNPEFKVGGVNRDKVQGVVDSLNKSGGGRPSLAAELNRMIKVKSHLEGHVNYQKTWQDILRANTFGADLREGEGDQE